MFIIWDNLKMKNKDFKQEIILGLLSLLPVIILISLFIIRIFCTSKIIIEILATIGFAIILGSDFYIFPALKFHLHPDLK